MKTCLVSLVSDQTIPNILVAAHFKPDCLLFLSTEKMEARGKTEAIISTLAMCGLDYSGEHYTVEVPENSISGLKNSVDRWLSADKKNWRFIVNLTGGNKLMSLAAYDFFKELGSDMVYVPIPENKCLSPFSSEPPAALEDRLSVTEYLTAFNFKIQNLRTLQAGQEAAFNRKNLTYFLFSHYEQAKPLLKWFSDKLRPLKEKRVKNGYEFLESFTIENETQNKIIYDLGFRYEGYQLSKKIFLSEWHYLRGGWLEERLFLAIKKALPINADVQIGVKFKDAF